MRLINAQTLEMRDFTESQRPRYAILSHCWEEGELLIAEYDRVRTLETAGARKVLKFCELVQLRDQKREIVGARVQWAWIDTCCIDKTSSAELSEAINSMFKWYKDAAYCVAYLNDVHTTSDETEKDAQFRKSRWFTRGWTLQELVAPNKIFFHNSDWSFLGHRYTFLSKIEEITGIDRDFINNDVLRASVAQRMSWASKRETSRAEDMAYCLLGIFDINMPLLYGEGGHKAFLRLQKEIIETTDDESIFAWTTTEEIPFYIENPLLATHPRQFGRSGGIQRVILPKAVPRNIYSITNRGLRFESTICSLRPREDEGENAERETIIISLACTQGREVPLAQRSHIEPSRFRGTVPCMLALVPALFLDRYVRVFATSLDLEELRGQVLDEKSWVKSGVERKILNLSIGQGDARRAETGVEGFSADVEHSGGELWRYLFDG